MTPPATTTAIGAAILIAMLVCSGCVEWRNVGRTLSDDKIVSLDLGQVTQGSFFLGSGNVNGVTYYYYYKVEPDGGYTLQQAPTRFSKIYKDATVNTSHVLIMDGDTGPIRCRNDQTDEYCIKHAWVIQRDYYFHVPQGTIVQSYNARLP